MYYLATVQPNAWHLITVINIVFIAAMIFTERREPSKIIAWACVLFVLPFVGFLIYFLLGRGPHLGRRKKVLDKIEKDEKYLDAIDAQREILVENQEYFNQSEAALVHFNLIENKSLCTFKNDVRLYTNIKNQYADMFDDMRAATNFIHISYFIIQSDYIGKELKEILVDKVKQGVKVRLIYDDIGSIKTPKNFFNDLIKAGGDVYRFFPSIFSFLGRNVNYRNHRKIVVIDGKIGYIGGANIGKEYIGERKSIPNWRDSHIRVVGNAVKALDIRFLQDFNFASGKNVEFVPQEPISVQGGNAIQIVSSGPDSPAVGIEAAYIKAIYSAKERVYVQTPYLILDEPFKMALISAARCGVDVRVMIPGTPDKKLVYYSSFSYARELYENGVTVLIYNGFLHSKILLVDNTISSVGTFNLDIRSFRLHFEVTAFVYGGQFAKELADAFQNDENECQLMTKEYLKTVKWWRYLIERISLLFSPLF